MEQTQEKITATTQAPINQLQGGVEGEAPIRLRRLEGATQAPKIEWPNLLFITLSPVVAVAGTLWVLRQGGYVGYTWALFGAGLFLTGLGITAGYHRLFAHQSYRAHWIVRLFYLLLGGASFQGSAREWCQAHRKHHQFVDQEKDPYNIKKGFWHAHVKWIVIKSDQSDESNIKDLKKDPLVLFQDRFFVPLATLVGIVLPAAVASLWGDIWGGLFIGGFLRVVVNHHLTFLINSYAHYFGKQNFSDRHSGKDSWILAFFTYGEGFHNFHHTFSADYRNGIRAYHWDPAKWLVACLSWVGLASRLNRANPHAIFRAKLEMDEKRFLAKMAHHARLYAEWNQMIASARLHLEQVHARFIELKTRYREIKMDDIRHEMIKAKNDLKVALVNWSAMVNGSPLPSPA